jgi:hypothetical protein
MSFRTVPDMEQWTVSTAPTGVPTEHSYGHCSPRNNYNIRPWPTLPLSAWLPAELERNRAERSETESRYNCRSSATRWMQCERVFNKSLETFNTPVIQLWRIMLWSTGLWHRLDLQLQAECSEIRILIGTADLSLVRNVHMASGAQPACIQSVPGFFLRGKSAGAWT